jgi:Tripartite tricarboxylate transporter family receptor
MYERCSLNTEPRTGRAEVPYFTSRVVPTGGKHFRHQTFGANHETTAIFTGCWSWPRNDRGRKAGNAQRMGAANVSHAAGADHRRRCAWGRTDIAARLIGQWLTVRLGQSFLVENRPGANNTIGTGAVVRAPPDGYTLLMSNSIDAINASLYQRLNYDFIRDIAPVAKARGRLLPPHSTKALVNRATSKGGMSKFCIAGLNLGTIDCRRWPQTSCADKWR